tara:strand:- start:9137 stop:10549 length:1413 start_codon:yes stop_codon:yes gene_type:complete
MNLILFIIVIILLIIILYLIFINKKTNLNFLKKIENNIENMTNITENIDLNSPNIEYELDKIENIIKKYDNDKALSEKNRIIINDLKNKIDVLRKELENPYVVAEFKKDIKNKMEELEKSDKITFNNKDNIKKIDTNLIETQKQLSKEYLKNKNSKITIDNDDYFKLCNNNDKCILMNVNEQGEYTIKSDTINFKNNDNNIIAKIDNDNIYFGGNNKENSDLYINKGETYINKLNTNELLLKDKTNNEMVDLASYVEWLDNNKNYREYIDDENYKNNVERIKEIDMLKNELKNINEQNQNLDKKINNNIDTIKNIDNNYVKLEDINKNITEKNDILKHELDEQLKTSLKNNQNIKQYKESMDVQLIKLYENINILNKKTDKMKEENKIKLDIYERNRIEYEENLLKQKKLREFKELEDKKRIEDEAKRMEELKKIIDDEAKEADERRKLERQKEEEERLKNLSSFFMNIY